MECMRLDMFKKVKRMKTIYRNGTILTMNEEALYAQALWEEDGRIGGLGSEEEILAMKAPGDRVVDLEGHTMLPAFIDAHSNFVGAANALRQCSLSSAESFAEIVELLQAFISENRLEKGTWVVGCNYDHNFLKEERHPDRYVLDQVGEGYPVLIVHASSHMGVANSLALELLGVDEKSEDTAGGRYGRVEGTTLPNGYMEEKVFLDFQSRLPKFSFEELLGLIVKVQDYYASYGIATVQDGMVGKPLFQLLDYAAKQNLLRLDVVGFADLIHDADLLDENPQYKNVYQNHLKLGGYKVFLDGSPQGKTAWMSSPYEGEEEYCGYPMLKDEELKELIGLSVDRDQQLLAHCNGDAAAEQYISQFEKVMEEKGIRETKRPVMVHAQLVRKDQLQRMAAMGMIPSFFVDHAYFWGDIHLKNFGSERGSHISPVRDALDLGMKATFHQDTPVIPPDMMRTVSSAVNRISRGGQVIGAEERISVLEALRAVTINAARQYFEEEEKGSLEPGKRADFAVLEKNPLLAPQEELAGIRVLETIKDGKTIYRRK